MNKPTRLFDFPYYQLENFSLDKMMTSKVGGEWVSYSTKEFIQKRLLLESKRLLYYSRLTVKEVAYELNFKEPAHFSNFFKKETGDYPLNFLNSLKLD